MPGFDGWANGLAALTWTCLSSFASAATLDANVDTTRERCGFDLTAIKARLVSAELTHLDAARLQVRYAIAWSRDKTRLEGSLHFDCAEPSSHLPALATPLLSPKALIEQEDAGGRYARHVAWQKPVKASNWSPQVAYVDYTLGDGQRTRGNDFLVCDRHVARPCLALSISKPDKLSANDLTAVMALIGGITILR